MFGYLRIKAFLKPVLIFLFLFENLESNQISGYVFDWETRKPIAKASVLLIPSDGTVTSYTIADEAGFFQIASLRAASYVLHAIHVGYKETVSNPIELGQDDSLEVHILLKSKTFEFDTVDVESGKMVAHLRKQGFYKRKDAGNGYFIERKKIEETAPVVFTDLLRSIPGLRVEAGFVYSSRYASLTTGACKPLIVVDGVPLRSNYLSIDSYVMPNDVEAVEIYNSNMGIPSRYRGLQVPCGAILIWTRR